MEITLADDADVPSILAISNWAAEHLAANFATEPETLASWRAVFEQTRALHPWLVARDEGRVIGFAKSGPHKSRGAYAWTAEVSVYVDPAAHRRGIGGALYDRMIPLLRAQGYVTLLAGITPPNPGSVGLHERFGFVRCGTYHKAGWKFGRWYDVGYWELQLCHDDGEPAPVRAVASVWNARE
jgi:phosphinothricin acetyltransferase